MRTALFLATIVASSLAKAAVPIEGLYGSLFGGYSYIPDNLSKQQHGINFDHAGYDNGFNTGLRLGYLINHWRYEGEFTYLQANVDSFRFGFFPVSLFPNGTLRVRGAHGQTNAAIGAGNIYYNFPDIVPCISPFLGAGLGFGWFKTSFSGNLRPQPNRLLNPLVNPFAVQTFVIQNSIIQNSIIQNPNSLLNPFFNRPLHHSSSGAAFVYQGTAGFVFNFTENYSLDLAYRYIGSTRVGGLGKVFQGNLASVGVTYRFYEYNYK